MNPVTSLFRREQSVPEKVVSPLSGLPVRKIAASAATAAATVVAVSAASAAMSALRRRAEGR